MNSHRNGIGRRTAALGAIVVAACLTGCGGGEFDVAPAHGRVVCDGEPVSGGSVTFAPVAHEGNNLVGKAATATIQPDGTFVLKTYAPEDGAVVGKHKVTYTPSEGSEEEEPEVEEGSPEEARLMAERAKQRRQPRPAVCRLPEPKTVEVTADGENDFTIDLTAAPRRRER